MGRQYVHKAFWRRNLKETDNLEELGVDGRVIFEVTWKIWLGEHRLNLAQDGNKVDRDSSVGIVTTQRAGRSGDQIPVGKRFSAPAQTGPGTHPASCIIITGSLSGGGGILRRAWSRPRVPL